MEEDIPLDPYKTWIVFSINGVKGKTGLILEKTLISERQLKRSQFVAPGKWYQFSFCRMDIWPTQLAATVANCVQNVLKQIA